MNTDTWIALIGLVIGAAGTLATIYFGGQQAGWW